jgi:quercetin dioxygenase-like cupin family protein
MRELIEKYHEYPELFAPPVEGVVPLNVARGKASCSGILKKPEVAALDSTYEMWTEFPSHSHEEQEYLIIYSGKLFVNVAGALSVLETGDVIHLASGVIHSAWTEDQPCSMLAVTVPANMCFPEVPTSGVRHDTASG